MLSDLATEELHYIAEQPVRMTFERCFRPNYCMNRPLPNREVTALMALMLFGVGTAVTMGQAPVPAAAVPTGATSPPSTLPASQATSATSQSVHPTSARPVPRLDVVFAGDKVTVDAGDASLNQVLRDIVQKTGMKISGSISDEKVFGHYGPSPVAEVLVALLEGTGSNVVLVESRNGPSELVLTPRHGAATPPNPNAAVAQSNPEEPQEQYVPPIRPFQPPIATGRGPVAANPDGSPSAGPFPQSETNFGPPGDDPNPKTPQQIYEQLQAIGAQHTTVPPDE